MEKKRRHIKLNIGLLIFIVIFFYLGVEIVLTIRHVTPTVYCVENSYIDDNYYLTGIAVRSESLIHTDTAGYVNYYIRAGERVAKNGTVYSLDENGSVKQYLAEHAGEEVKLAASDYENIQKRISVFRVSYSDNEYNKIYGFKSDMQNMLLDVASQLLIEQATKGENQSQAFKLVSSDQSGVVSYYEDGYETLLPNDINAACFDTGKYQKKSLKTAEVITAGSPVYKLVTDDNWNLIAPLSEEQASVLAKKQAVTVHFNSLNHDVDCNFEIMKKGDGSYLNITMNKLMVEFIEDRYVDITILNTSPKGLKIPNSSIVENEVYRIPAEYLTAGANSASKIYLNKRISGGNGGMSVELMTPNIVSVDEKYVYISKYSLPDDTVLVKPNSSETLTVKEMGRRKFRGVYSANKGIALFKRVEIIDEKDDFSIVAAEVDYSIGVYDYILINAEGVKEGQIIY